MAFATDNNIWQILIASLNVWSAQFLIDFSSPVVVARSYQPEQVDVPEGLVLFISKIHSKRYGWQSYTDVYNPLSGFMDHTERYIMNDTFQIDTQSTTDPNETVASIRAADVAESVSAYLQSISTIQSLHSTGLDIIRIENIRHAYFLNDFNRFESGPSFDFTVAYTQEIETEVAPVVPPITGEIHPI